MPTTSKTTSTSTTTSPTADLAQQLESSQSATIYVDLPDLDDAGAEALLEGDPPLHVEHDAVRNLWAVRKATEDEVEAAAAAKAADDTASASSATPASSSTSSAT
jgi:hypothetical protein